MSDQPAETPAPQPPEPRRHCWHQSPKQHTHLKLHADIRCCNCGLDLCVDLVTEPPKGHGAYTPVGQYVTRPAKPLADSERFCAEPDTQG